MSASRGGTRKRIEVLVVAPHRLVAEGTFLLLSQAADLHVIGVERSFDRADIAVTESLPDVVFIQAPSGSHGAVLSLLRAIEPLKGTRGLVLADQEDGPFALSALTAGACGVVGWDVGAEELIEAVRSASRYGVVASPIMTRMMLSRLREYEEEAPASNDKAPILTQREIEILTLIADGATNQQVAHSLHISVSTAKNYLNSIFRKLGVDSRSEAIAKSYRLQLLSI